MSQQTIHVLLIEDDPNDARLIRKLLADIGRELFMVEWAERLSAGLVRLEQGGIGVVLLDLSLPDSQDFATLRAVQMQAPSVPILILSRMDDETLAIQAMHAGAQDCLFKGHMDETVLGRAIRYAIARKQTDERRRQIKERVHVSQERFHYRDVTEQIQSETALRASEARLAGIISSAMDAIISIDDRMRICVFNSAAEHMFGCTAARAIGQPIDQFIPSRFRRAHAEHIKFFGRTGVTSRVMGSLQPLSALRSNGEEFPIEAAISQIVAAGQKFYTVIIRDITERKRAEDALRQSEERFSKAFHASPAAKSITRLSDGALIDANPSFLRMLGYERDEPIDARLLGLGMFLDSAERAEILRKLQKQEPIRDFEITLRAKSGDIREVLLSLEMIELGGEVCILSFLYDITERKRAEAQVRQLNSELEQRVSARTAELARSNTELQSEIAERVQLELQIQASADRATALATLSRALAEAGHEIQPLFEIIVDQVVELIGDACVLTALSDNQATMEVMAIGHPRPEAKTFMRTLFPAPYPANEGMAGQVARTGQPILMPVILPEHIRAQIKPEYQPYLDRFGLASLLIVPLRARGRIVGTLGVSRDRPGRPYTERDQTFLQDLADRAGLAIENARLFRAAELAREEAERASRTKSAFLASMSHELRTPLNAILGFTGTLLMRLPGPLNPSQEKQLKTVQTSARHLLSLINDILDLARVESGKVVLRLESMVGQEVIDEVATSLRPLAETKGLQFVVRCPTEPVVMRSDRRVLSQILINLINNAIKFTDQGEVRIELTCEQQAERALVAIRVLDTGIGIAAEDQLRLFQEFGRVESAAVRQREGTGLGLRLSQMLVQLLGGKIELTSALGRGSTFTLMLPKD